MATSRPPLKEGYEGVQEVVFAAKGTRTIFGSYCRLLENVSWNTPNENDVKQAKVICLDPFFKEASSRVAEIGFRAGIPVVTVDCRYDDRLLRYTSAVVIAESFIRENYPDLSIEDLFQRYQRHTGGDSVRAGIVYGFLQGLNVDRMVEFAAAVAALVCTRFPGVLNSPSRDEVLEFIRANRG